MKPAGPLLFAPLVAALALSGCQLTKSRVSVDYYAISGDSTAKLDREIRRKGPRIDGGRHAVAVARIRMVPNIRYQPTTNGCRIQRARVNVDARVTLPLWTGRRGASKKLGKAWDNIDRYTRLHESVHVAIAFRYAGEMETALRKLTSRVSCADLRDRAGKLIKERLAAHDAAQRQFDEDEQRRLSRVLRSDRRSTS